MMTMNVHAVRAIYSFEMARTRRTLLQSIVSPVISTSLYFVVFGAAIGARITEIEGVRYGAFIVPGLIMLTLLTQSVMNASFGIYFPRFTGTIYEILSAPVSYLEIVLGYVGAAATKSVILGLIILATAGLFVPLKVDHPLWMVVFLLLQDQLGEGLLGQILAQRNALFGLGKNSMPLSAAVGTLIHAGMAALMSAALQRMWLRNRGLAVSMVLLIFIAFQGALVALAIGKI